jgi:hypothetical protein
MDGEAKAGRDHGTFVHTPLPTRMLAFEGQSGVFTSSCLLSHTDLSARLGSESGRGTCEIRPV